MPGPLARKFVKLAEAGALVGVTDFFKKVYHKSTDQKRLKNINKTLENDGNLSDKQKKFLTNFQKSKFRKKMNSSAQNPNTGYLNNAVFKKMGGSIGAVGPNGVL